MENVELKVDGNILTAKIDLSKVVGPSKSKKTIVIGSTQGNAQVPGHDDARIGVNVYKYPTA